MVDPERSHVLKNISRQCSGRPKHSGRQQSSRTILIVSDLLATCLGSMAAEPSLGPSSDSSVKWHVNRYQ